MKCALCVVLLLVAVCAGSTPAPAMPTMPLGFSADFAWWRLKAGGVVAPGWWFYQQSPLISVHVYPNASQMFYCSGTGQPLDQECRVYSDTQRRYVIFPQDKWCCHCCDAATCAGPLMPDWLQVSGAKYVGREKSGNVLCDVWGSSGAQYNLWFTDVESGLPVLFAEYDLTSGSNLANTTYFNVQTCHPSSYFTALPDYCASGQLPLCDGYCATVRSSGTLLVDI